MLLSAESAKLIFVLVFMLGGAYKLRGKGKMASIYSWNPTTDPNLVSTVIAFRTQVVMESIAQDLAQVVVDQLSQ